MKPNFSFEKKLAKQGFDLIAGVDEVGRGCFAGPVVAGCVVFGKKIYKSKVFEVKINDSKKLSQKQREAADRWIRENAHAYGLGQASVAQINRFGIKKATEIAFRKAIKDCEVGIDYLLIDAFYVPYVKGLRRRNQKAIVKGDTKSVSIAAASIIAKVYRDKLMVDLSKEAKYKKYRWEKNKGYGTKEHQKMILKHCISKLHRSQFVESWIKNSSSSRAR
jgi:ribonuclease HII